MRMALQTLVVMLGSMVAFAPSAWGQRMQFPQPPSSLRDAQAQTRLASGPVMVPLNPATQQGLYPSTSPGSALFDPYATRPSYQNPGYQFPPTTGTPTYGSSPYGSPAPSPNYGGALGAPSIYTGSPYNVPNGSMPATTFPSTSPGTYAGAAPGAVYPSTSYPGNVPYAGNIPGNVGTLPSTATAGAYGAPLTPSYPGVGQSGSIGNYTGAASGVYPPGMYPNNAPPSLFPTSVFGNGSGGMFGGLFGNGSNPYGYAPGGYAPGVYGGVVNNGTILAPGATGPSPYWNAPGTAGGAWPGGAQFIRFFQGPRFRHTYIYGDDDPDSLQINDSDVSLAFAVPNFLFSTQPLYILPSFSLHQWEGPKAPLSADLPSKAYSAFIDTGWQSDPLRLLGAELGVRVGVFSDFETFTSDSIRVMGRGLGRLRLTPTATLKGGIIYLDRNRVELLPAGGILWQPNPATRYDLFFPEPKLSHYLSTVGNFDTWGYLTAYYGGGAWTIERANGTDDSVDINDIRVLLGLEFGRNDQLRDGRRVSFVEAGYVFDRELFYKHSPADNVDLADSFVIRAGIGY